MAALARLALIAPAVAALAACNTAERIANIGRAPELSTAADWQTHNTSRHSQPF